MTEGSVVSTDGRLARSERTRLAIVEAMLALIDGGEIQPTVEGIAAKAGVAQRTVFQHYADREALFAAASARQAERIAPLMGGPPTTGPLAMRLDAFLARRATLYETITPVRRATLHMAPLSVACDRAARAMQSSKRAEAVRVFAPEISRCPVAERAELEASVGAVTSWSTWHALRHEQGLSVEAARGAMRRTVRALLARG